MKETEANLDLLETRAHVVQLVHLENKVKKELRVQVEIQDLKE